MYKVYVKSKNEINIKNNIESDYTDKSLKEISKKAWTYLFDILKNDYNIEWKSPQELNPNIKFN